MSAIPGEPLLYPPLCVRVLPAYEACNYEHVRGRLADRRLVAAGVAIQVHRIPLLAVPVGGRPRKRRHGGYFITEQKPIALAVHDLLVDLGRPDFPDLRIRQASEPTPWVVEWGEPAPVGSPQARARFYGYSADAIATGRFSLPPLPAVPSAASPDPLSGSRPAVVPPQCRREPERDLTSFGASR